MPASILARKRHLYTRWLHNESAKGESSGTIGHGLVFQQEGSAADRKRKESQPWKENTSEEDTRTT